MKVLCERDSCEKPHRVFSPLGNFSEPFPIRVCKLLTSSHRFKADLTLMYYFFEFCVPTVWRKKTGDTRASNGLFLNSASDENASLAPDQGATSSGRISGFLIFLEKHHV